MVEQAERVKQDTTSMWDELVAEYGGEECSKGDRQKCETQKERWLMPIDKYHSKLTALKGADGDAWSGINDALAKLMKDVQTKLTDATTAMTKAKVEATVPAVDAKLPEVKIP